MLSTQTSVFICLTNVKRHYRMFFTLWGFKYPKTNRNSPGFFGRTRKDLSSTGKVRELAICPQTAMKYLPFTMHLFWKESIINHESPAFSSSVLCLSLVFEWLMHIVLPRFVHPYSFRLFKFLKTIFGQLFILINSGSNWKIKLDWFSPDYNYFYTSEIFWFRIFTC